MSTHALNRYLRPRRRLLPLGVSLLALAIGLSGWGASAAEPVESVAAGSIAELETLTARDDPGALLELASRYQQGRGVPRDLPRAAGLYERAAKLGNAEAQYNLGNLYLLGEGLPQDDDWAFTWYRAAARQGHALAQKNVAEFYRAAGMQPPTDDTAGTPALLSPAQSAGTAANGKADDDDDVAPSNLPNAPVPVPAEVSADEMSAMELARSRGIQIDAAPAPAYPPVIEPAVPVGPTASAAMPNERDPQLEPARLALAAGKAPSALPLLEGKAAEGNAEAQWLLAQVLYSMKRNAEDQNNALLWLQRAATAGWRDAQFALGQRYDRGEGVVADEAEAVTWYRAAARQGHAAALERLQAIYRNAGLPVPPLEPVQVPATPSASLNGRDLPCTRIDCSPPTV